jgi:hypothetical protein
MPIETTTTREIKREEWADFFDGFSRRHEDWLVTIELLDPKLGDQIEVENHALRGIVAERRRDPEVIEIFTENREKQSTTNVVEKPTRVWIEESAEGAEAALEIEAQDGAKTLLRFRSAALPETVDGAGPER